MTREERRAQWGELVDAVRKHCNRHPGPPGHYDQCVEDLRKEKQADWEWFTNYFKGEIA